MPETPIIERRKVVIEYEVATPNEAPVADDGPSGEEEFDRRILRAVERALIRMGS